MAPRDPRADRALLGGWIVTTFALSAVTDARVLAAALAVAALAFRRGLARTARRVLVTVVPLTAGLTLASWAWLRLVADERVDAAPFAALFLRTVTLAFLAFAVLSRVDLFRALAPWPTATRLLVVTLAQVHALRLLLTESLLGLRSRLPRKPRPTDVLRGAGGITGTLLTLSTRNARDVSEAMRSRGF